MQAFAFERCHNVFRRYAAVLSARYHVLAPEKLDGKRDQNSIILAAKSRFDVDGRGLSLAHNRPRV